MKKKISKKHSSLVFSYQVGDVVFIHGLKCEVLFVNNGILYCGPRKDDRSKSLFTNCVCAKLYPDGKIQVL